MKLTAAFLQLGGHRCTRTWLCAALLVAISLFTSSFDNNTERELRAKQVNILIRQMGHTLLLQSGDSGSRVLPVTEIKEGTFQLRFAKSFVLSPDSMMVLAKNLFPEKLFPSGYMVTVHNCGKVGIVSGFMVNHNSQDILACKGRTLPADCYILEFTFPGLYDEQALKAGLSQMSDANKSNTEPRTYKASGLISGNPIFYVLCCAFLMIGVCLLLLRSRNTQQVTATANPDLPNIQEPRTDLPALGKYRFNVKGQYLLSGTEIITLTDKECRVLELLYQNFGELITRDTLMQEAWLNEGVITGRSLDMFVSKLRKKLSGDPDLGITNVHGKGYKLQLFENHPA